MLLYFKSKSLCIYSVIPNYSKHWNQSDMFPILAYKTCIIGTVHSALGCYLTSHQSINLSLYHHTHLNSDHTRPHECHMTIQPLFCYQSIPRRTSTPMLRIYSPLVFLVLHSWWLPVASWGIPAHLQLWSPCYLGVTMINKHTNAVLTSVRYIITT